MSKTQTLTLIVIILILTLACGPALQIIEPTPDGRSAPPAAGTPLLITGATPEPPEIESGAVFIIPEYWQAAQLAPTKPPMLQKGRRNYQ